MKRFVLGLLVVALLPLSFVAGMGASSRAYGVPFQGRPTLASNGPSGVPTLQGAGNQFDHERYTQDFGLLWDVVDQLRQVYYKPYELNDKAVHGAIRGLLRDSLEEPYTRFLDPKANEDMKIDTSGEFYGVGIFIGYIDNSLAVIEPIQGTPAYKAGLKAKDYILKIDGKDTTDMAMDQAVALIRGPRGSTVTLNVYRKGFKEPKDFKMERDKVVVPIMDYKFVDAKKKDVGMIRIRQFNEHTSDEFRKAYRELIKKGMKKLVFDLRSNPGGLLDQAVEMSSLFLEDGPVVHVEERGTRRMTQMSRKGMRIVDVPTVVLVNGSSASASEILAGCIQDNKLGVLMGQKTFGKGLVQTIYHLRNNTAVVITTARYLTSKGRDINKAGIVPDEPLKYTDEQLEAAAKKGDDPMLNDAVKYLRAGKADKFTWRMAGKQN